MVDGEIRCTSDCKVTEKTGYRESGKTFISKRETKIREETVNFSEGCGKILTKL